MGSSGDDQNIRAPTVRRCERCGRVERWNSHRETWERCRTRGPEAASTRHCIHEWDVTGSFCPVVSEKSDRARTPITTCRTD